MYQLRCYHVNTCCLEYTNRQFIGICERMYIQKDLNFTVKFNIQDIYLI